MHAIVVSREFPERELLVGPEALGVADVYLHPVLKRRVGAQKGGALSRLRDGGIDLLNFVAPVVGKALVHAQEKHKDQTADEPFASLLTGKTCKTELENELVKLAREQAALVRRMASDVNMPCGEHAMEGLIPGDRLTGTDPDGIPLSGIVGPTEAVYSIYKEQLDAINSGKFKKFFSQCSKNGCKRLHLFDLARARKHFTRRGGGVIDENVYVLHPKRDGVLVPIETYHQDLLKELHQESVVALGRLGAKTLTIETVSGMTLSGSTKKKEGTIDIFGNSSLGAEKSKNESHKWGSPTYDPEHAIDGCSLVQDNCGVMTLRDLRTTTDLVEFNELATTDTTFNLGIEVVQLINSKFTWEAKSQYRYVVEFFSRAELPTRVGPESG